ALAMQVQQSLLPEIPPVVEGLDIAGASKYCDETGGDYFDFIELNELRKGRLGVAIGDVAGHGVSAALLMATARALLRSRITMPGSLAEVFGDVNRHLCEGQFSGRFMTLFYLMIDTTGRRLSWISAGHDPAMLYDPASDAFTELKGTDVPLGLDGAWQFRECEGGSWREGQVLVMGTDGIWECRDRGREMFGKVRLQEIVRANAGKAAKEIAGAITQAVQEHRGGAAQQDDITLVVIRWTPRK
ncbi:MAG: PP2C family protein-serine/threonine phosphatase, partial [Phycisphaeraceae bacterium]